MKLIIDIHKKDYQSILNSGQVPYGVICAIMNGTPLPKGHGDLIDRRSFRENIDMCRPFTKYWQDHNPVLNRAKSELLLCLESEPIIIEADKEG